MSTAELVLIVGLAGVALLVGFVLGRKSKQGTAAALRVPSGPQPPKESMPSSRTNAPYPERGSTAPARAAGPGKLMQEPPRLLARARCWGYQLQGLDLDRASASPFDLLVVDYAKDGSDETALTAAEVTRLKRKPDGSRRLVLAYLSIGEAESYRFYWRKDWKRSRPEWLLKENPDWEENYAVCFWHPGWQALLCGGPDAYLDRIIAQGFDGIYLDKCDVTEDLRRNERRTAATRKDLDGDMVELVRKLASYAREKRPAFLVVMQNAEPLLERPELRAIIDGVGKEELLFGLDSAEKLNDREEVSWSRERLDLMKKDGKPVFVVEYLNDRAKIATAAEAARRLDYILYVADKTRELDELGDAMREA